MAIKQPKLETIFRNVGELTVDQQFRAIVDALDTHHPHIAGFVEVKVPRRRLRTIPGYRVLQGLHGEAGHVVAMVRRDVKVRRTWIRRMTQTWVGPKLLKPKAPRAYRSLVAQLADRSVWDVDVEHWPSGGPTGGVVTGGRNRAAWWESLRRQARSWRRRAARLARAGRGTAVVRPRVAILDANATEAELEHLAADRDMVLIPGSKVDHALAQDATGRSERLTADQPHPLMGFTFTADAPNAPAHV